MYSLCPCAETFPLLELSITLSKMRRAKKRVASRLFGTFGEDGIFPVFTVYPILGQVIRMFSTGFSTFLWTIVDNLDNYVENSFPLSKK